MRNVPELAGGRSLLLLLILGLGIYVGSASRAGFLNFDDNLFFGPGEHVFAGVYDDGDLAPILDPSQTIANAYLPVSHLSLYADYVVHRSLGLGAPFAHVHSLLLHILAAFALARLLGRLGLARVQATAAAALVLVHPALVESVAWVSSRKDLLSGLFGFMCLSAVARSAVSPSRGRVLLVAVWAILAIYSKGTAVVLVLLAPFVALLASGRLPMRGLAFAIVPVVLGGWHHMTVAAAQGTMQSGGLWDRLVRVPGAFLHYLETLVWPSHLNVLYPEIRTLESFEVQWVAGVVVLAAVFGTAVLAWFSGRRLVAAGLVMTLAALTPFNTAWPASAIAAADRYLYLAAPWLALSVMALFAKPRLAMAVAAVGIVPLAALAVGRAGDFENSRALWQSSLAMDPDNAVARINLAVELQAEDPVRARGLVEGALKSAAYPQHRFRAAEFLRELALRDGRMDDAVRQAAIASDAAAELPETPAARELHMASLLRLATLLLAQEEADGARFAVDRARELAPEHPTVLAYEAALLLTEAVDAEGRVEPDAPDGRRADELLSRAFAVDPDHVEAHLASARWAQARGELMAAIRHFRRVRKISPKRPDAYIGEADLFLNSGDFAAAEEVVRAATRQQIDDPNLLVRFGLAKTGQGELETARDYYKAYLEIRPYDEPVRRSLAAVLAAETTRVLYQLGPAELEAAAKRISELDPRNPKVSLIRGLAKRLQRDMPGALAALERARKDLPGDDEVLRLLAETHRDQGYQLLGEEDPPDRALDHFRAFVDLGVLGVDPSSALGILQVNWSRYEKVGVAAFEDGDLVAAERAFSRCVELLPEQSSAQFQLGLAVLAQGQERTDEALRQFEAAEKGRLAQGLDTSMPVLYQVLALRRLGRMEEARERGARVLDEPGDAGAEVLERIRAAIE